MTTKQDANFELFLKDMYALYLAKSAAYGPESIAESGEEGIITRMTDKLARLKHLRKTGGPENDESIEDTILDLANYCGLLTVYRSGNWGK